MPILPATAAAGSAVTVTLSGAEGVFHVVHNVTWSYSALATTGRITVTDGGASVVDLDIVQAPTASLPDTLLPIQSQASSTAMVITLGAGGLSVVGKLVVDYDDVTFQ